jgi:peptide/nickel transport system permease protein
VLVFVRNRIIFSIPVVLGVSILVFLMLHALPGDPVQVMMGQSASAEAAARVRHQLGLDQPIYVQYAQFVGHALTGDLGRSIRTNQPVMDLILSQFPSTLQLTFAGLGFAVVIGLLLGTIAATHHQSWIDNSSMVVAVIGVSMPSFWLGFLLIAFFSLRLGWFPATGQGGLNRLVLPALALGIGASAVIARLVRSSMLEVMRQEYIHVARAKGLRSRTVIYRHALRNALIPVITIIGLQFGQLLAGTVIIETVFSRQGLGRLTIDAILNKDYPVVQGTILFTAVGYVMVNLIVDILYAVIDPRVTYD